MKMFYVKLLTELCGEVQAESEEEAIEKMKYSIKSDSYDNGEFEAEEIEIVNQAFINI